LFQRLSVALQRFNAVLLHDIFDPKDDLDQQQHCFIAFNPWELYTQGIKKVTLIFVICKSSDLYILVFFFFSVNENFKHMKNKLT